MAMRDGRRSECGGAKPRGRVLVWAGEYLCDGGLLGGWLGEAMVFSSTYGLLVRLTSRYVRGRERQGTKDADLEGKLIG